MKTQTLKQPGKGVASFSLVEVVLALGICSFALLAILGLFTVGLQTNKDSEGQIQAANVASLIISERQASPTIDLANFAIPARAMTNAFGNAYNNGSSWTNYIGIDGRLTNAANAAYLIGCRAGTNAMTGERVSQVYLMLSWPPQMNPTNSAAGHYELITQIPIR